MGELKNLAEAAGYEVLGSIEQVRHPGSRYQIGSGKAEELAELTSKLKVDKIIFGNELKSVQAYNLAKLTGVEVIDRFQLILEIFVRRASTAEAKLQIELARLRYELPRAREKVRLARMGEQPGFLGLGKYEVDIYHETIQRQVNTIQKKLRRIRKTRKLHRIRRRKLGFPSVSLAGYTNSGKSTLFNSLTEENVDVDSGVFTTLSTTIRSIKLSGRKVLLTDTVGFVDQLPITLIEAFRSTLEETIFSDLILLVVDASEPELDIERKLSCCLDTIQQIGAGTIPIITALNKIDLLPDDELKRKIEYLKDLAPNPIPVSALYKTNIDSLTEQIAKYFEDNVRSSFSLPVSAESMPLISWVFDNSTVHDINYESETLKVSFESPPQFAEKVRSRIEKLGGVFNRGRTESLCAPSRS
ncbi:MAG: GTPase HflX [Candidatus Bathyarchaeia archaeon]